ncbi:hypothetical protein [Colwellia piezophila]|uniref:hypothetical protein n=1 Tax=Colwellia piezophila TaxID=211668 RepID=UPI0012FC499B|nr:hypothetical protein [Colwellia piezophila]
MVKIIKLEVLNQWDSPLRGLDVSKGGYQFGLDYLATIKKSNCSIKQVSSKLYYLPDGTANHGKK